jgi:transposase-like protein
MAITEEVLDELMRGYKGPDDFYGPDGLVKQLSKALIERAMQAELTEQIGYGKSESVGKPSGNRRNRKATKTQRSDEGPKEIAAPAAVTAGLSPRLSRSANGNGWGLRTKSQRCTATG